MIFCGLFALSRPALAYPNSEKAQLSLTDVTSQAVQTYLTSDNRYLYLGFTNKVKVVDLGTFDLRGSSHQPYDFGSDTDFDGIVGGLTLSNSRLYVSKDDGKMLHFSLDDLTAKPTSVTISSGVELGKMAINAAKTRLYIVDKDNNNLFVHTIGSATTSTIEITPSVTGASITNMMLASSVSGGSDYIYLTTDKGLMYYIVDGNSTATEAVVADSTDRLTAVSILPTKDYVYVVNTTDKQVMALSATALSLVYTIDLIINEAAGKTTYNDSPTGVVCTSVTNPTSTYKYVSGLAGVSVINANDQLINVDTSGSYQYNPIAISGSRYGPLIASSDRYVYMFNEGGLISVITANPYVAVSSVAYSSGGSSMSNGESATVTFQSDEDGTYGVRVGGSIDQSGTYLVDTAGASTGSVTASTDTAFTFNYDDNSSNLAEGSNTVFIFVTDSDGDVGRIATSVTVDTPPPAVTVTGTGFGNNRIYVYITRLDISDMSYYNVYTSEDADAVVNKTVSPTQVTQPSSGSTVTGDVAGLTNDVLYYVSVEAVDAGGNVGPLTYTYSDGSRITGSPEYTAGPAELTGEKGCSLARAPGRRDTGTMVCLVLLAICGILVLVRLCHCERPKGAKQSSVLIFIFLLLFLAPKNLFAEESSSQWWTTELKGGFWMPTDGTMKKFFEPCCHMTGMVNQGFLYKSKYGVEVGVGFLSENGTAVGMTSGVQSADRFNLFLLPVETNLAFRADFLENQVLVPYVKFGFDYVYFRENLKGSTTNGLKTGLHTAGGVQILLDLIDKGCQSVMEQEYGINDVYFTLEARYNWINDFGGKGLDLSSLIFSFGLLFEY